MDVSHITLAIKLVSIKLLATKFMILVNKSKVSLHTIKLLCSLDAFLCGRVIADTFQAISKINKLKEHSLRAHDY
ncbi:hypothetical protein FHR90_000674 [Endobacter medicaginis]|uniref:Uncharacterized protein n=1 Tax=Endobacter medicaginis TaxID=1181271 RepID=A0A839UXN0_9PROT|nr:hypothetical protein [Endobacter medicaginis]MBB3172860.1 hypothetical protein [Endobacter medicaginis]